MILEPPFAAERQHQAFYTDAGLSGKLLTW